jgi:hypothetical protein
MAKFFICKVDLTYKKFFISTILVDLFLNTALIALAIWVLLKKFHWHFILFSAISLVYSLFAASTLIKFIRKPDLRTGANKLFATVRLLLVLGSLYGITYLSTLYNIMMFYEGAYKSSITAYCVSVLVGAVIYSILNLYWSYMLIAKITVSLPPMSQNLTNEYYQDYDHYQD